MKGAVQYFGWICGMPTEEINDRFKFLSRLLELPPNDRYIKNLRYIVLDEILNAYVDSSVNIKREKFVPGSGFKHRFPALHTYFLSTGLLSHVQDSGFNSSLVWSSLYNEVCGLLPSQVRDSGYNFSLVKSSFKPAS